MLKMNPIPPSKAAALTAEEREPRNYSEQSDRLTRTERRDVLYGL